MGANTFHTEVGRRMETTGCAPAHMLLAALAVRQTITTNYDVAHECALTGALGTHAYRVLARQTAAQPKPWLLKLHGDARHQKTIVITESGYEDLRTNKQPLLGLVESLLLTSHLMFVGYSMGDPDFVEAARRVHRIRRLATGRTAPPIATVLALNDLTTHPLPEFELVTMGDELSRKESARKLEIFLDRISWAAARHSTRSNSYLLDDDYADLFRTRRPKSGPATAT